MDTKKLRVLVVDDEPTIRSTLSLVLNELGYHARSAEDGFAALYEIRDATPDILISDLHMQGMSGFELLSIVRRRFPKIPVLAMSGAFGGNAVPYGVPADAFYRKGDGIDSLLKSLNFLAQNDVALSRKESPIWFSQNGHDRSGSPYVTIACPECLRAFPQAISCDIHVANQSACIYCGASIKFTIASMQYL